MQQAHNEVAAWLLARETGMARLVPTTVLRQVPAPGGGEVEDSAQVLWPRFVLAQGHFNASHCPDELGWKIAVFDYVIANSDRNDGNWVAIDGRPEFAVLIDHGNSITHGPRTSSPFAQARNGQHVPPEIVETLRGFVNGASNTRLNEVLDGQHVSEIVERIRRIVDSGMLTLQ